MFQLLLESGARPRVLRSGRWTATSVAAHATLIAVAIMATMHDVDVSVERGRPPAPLVFVQPITPQLRQESAPASAATFTFPSVARIPMPMVPRIDPMGTRPISITPAEIFGTGLAQPTSAPAGLSSGGVYTDRLVDHPVIARGDNGSPEYPAQLRMSGAGLEGDVTVRFVVDSSGRVEPGSIAIMTSTHSLFSDAVRRWLVRTRYTPADVSGHPVRQLVEQRVNFTLRR